ncbi:hypothetical protein ACA910_014147 [Epithemia clementina (nom. ined.)]
MAEQSAPPDKNNNNDDNNDNETQPDIEKVPTFGEIDTSPTKDTVLTKDSSSAPNSPVSPMMVTHSFHQANSKPRSRIAGMSRPVFGAVSLLAAGAAALGVWTGVRVPELNTQVAELEKQVNRLEYQVDRLEIENERYKESNNELNATIYEFEEQNAYLNETSMRLALSVVNLTEDVAELVLINLALTNITNDLSDQNNLLNETNTALAEDVAELNATVTDLNARNEELAIVQDNLASNITRLEQENEQLNQTEQDLQEILNALEVQNEQLNESLTELENITSWFNQSVQGTNAELQLAIVNLSSMIEENRFYGIESLYLADQDTLNGWDCGMSRLYQPQFANPLQPVDTTTWNSMVDTMTEPSGTITNLCLNASDYDNYLDTRFSNTSNRTTQNFIDGTNIYTRAAMAYMYPNDPSGGENGLSHADWERAEYECDNITQFQYPLTTSL